MRPIMKKLILICLLPLFLSGCKTSGSTYPFYTQESYTTPGRHVIKSADGKVQGYLQQSKIDHRRTVQYDRKGNEDVADVTDEALEQEVRKSPLVNEESDMTIKRLDAGFTFVNFNFET